MVEMGHFDELDNILNEIYKKGEQTQDKEMISSMMADKEKSLKKISFSIDNSKKYGKQNVFVNNDILYDIAEGDIVEVTVD